MASQKKRRLEEPLQLIGLPDEILVHTMSYLNPQETWHASCVSSRLCKVATNCLREAALEADPLSADIFKSIHNEKANGNSVFSLRPAKLWTNLLVGRQKCMQPTEYHSVCDGGVPYELPPDEELPSISNYRFAVRLWVKDWGNDNLSAITVRVPSLSCLYSPNDIIFMLSMTKKPLQGEQDVSCRLKSGDYFALEIVFSAVTGKATKSAKWATLYSSLRPLQPYGGGDFEEYEAMPWFVGDIDERWHHRAAQKWAWLPFSKVHIDTFSDQTRINLRFQWFVRHGQRLHYQYSGGVLEGFNRLNFLKHRCNQATHNGDENGNSKLPRCLRTPIIGLENFAPKPLEAYSFRIDIQKESDPSEKQSILFEGLPNEELHDDEDFPRLSFEIPKEYHDCFPWAEDYGNGTNTAQLVEFDEKISVYAIDRHSGKQAKVFESGACEIWEYFSFHPFLGFEKSAALSQYNFGIAASTIPVPAIAGMMYEIWKEGDFVTGESPPSSRTFQLSLQFQCYSGLGQGTGGAVGNVDGTSKDILTFLEKGLAYK